MDDGIGLETRGVKAKTDEERNATTPWYDFFDETGPLFGIVALIVGWIIVIALAEVIGGGEALARWLDFVLG